MKRKAKINLFNNKIAMKSIYSIEANEEDKVYIISIYVIEIAKKIFEKTIQDLLFSLILEDEQKNKFKGLTEKIEKRNDFFLVFF